MKAVIDRFEGDYAVVLFGKEEIKVDIPKKLLPDEAKEGAWLKVDLKIDEKATGDREKRINNLMNNLKNK